MAGVKGKSGGNRGGGRPPGRSNKATVEQKGTIEEMARAYGPQVLASLAEIATKSQSPAARVAACQALLERGYGKPRQAPEPPPPTDPTPPSGAAFYPPMMAPFKRNTPADGAAVMGPLLAPFVRAQSRGSDQN